MEPSIHLTQWGEAGPRVVMVHGSAQGSEYGGDRHFSAQARLADRGWRIVAPDRPGHGRSPAPGRPDDADADGLWVADLLGDGAHLVGHSFGGCVALAAAARRPAAVRSLTLIEPAVMAFAFDDPAVQAFGGRMGALFAAAGSDADLATGFIELVRIPPEIRGGSTEPELERVGAALRQLKLPTLEQLTAWLSVVRDGDIPFLVVTGGWNPAFEAVGERAAQTGGGRHVVIRSEHHFPQIVSDEFNDTLAEFMSTADRHAAARPRRRLARS